MSYCVQYQLKLFEGQLRRGDVLVSNHPQAGGSHLPVSSLSLSAVLKVIS